MTAKEKIIKYLNKRTSGATAKEIAQYAKVTYKTVKNIVGNPENGFIKEAPRKCRVSGDVLTTYYA